jgi:hypothetical protein
MTAESVKNEINIARAKNEKLFEQQERTKEHLSLITTSNYEFQQLLVEKGPLTNDDDFLNGNIRLLEAK